jgi:hypothetical protein
MRSSIRTRPAYVTKLITQPAVSSLLTLLTITLSTFTNQLTIINHEVLYHRPLGHWVCILHPAQHSSPLQLKLQSAIASPILKRQSFPTGAPSLGFPAPSGPGGFPGFPSGGPGFPSGGPGFRTSAQGSH